VGGRVVEVGSRMGEFVGTGNGLASVLQAGRRRVARVTTNTIFFTAYSSIPCLLHATMIKAG
jgi:hypothetical protein